MRTGITLATLVNSLAFAGGCFNDTSSGGTNSGGTSSSGSTGDSCPVGSEACACTTGNSCDAGLQCLSGVCVSSNNSGTGSSDTTTGMTGGTGSSGTTTGAGSGSTGAASDSGSTGGSPYCGDGNTDAGLGEQCDDGPDNGAGQACLSNCVNNVCGDGDQGPAEFCDDGGQGAMVGECAPDCSVVIVQKSIVISSTTSSPNLSGIGNVIAEADGLCPGGHRALFSLGSARRATVTANVGDGQIDWVLTPWTRYVNSGGNLVALTDSAALLGVKDGAFAGLTSAISPGNNGGALTGMHQDWTTMTADNCSQWTSTASNVQGMTGIPGSITQQFLRQARDFTYPCSGIGTRPVYCVEQ